MLRSSRDYVHDRMCYVCVLAGEHAEQNNAYVARLGITTKMEGETARLEHVYEALEDLNSAEIESLHIASRHELRQVRCAARASRARRVFRGECAGTSRH